MKAIELLQYAKKYNANITDKMIDEAIVELEEFMKPKSCESCSADCSIKDALNTHGQFWDYPCDVGCKSRYEPKENL